MIHNDTTIHSGHYSVGVECENRGILLQVANYEKFGGDESRICLTEDEVHHLIGLLQDSRSEWLKRKRLAQSQPAWNN